MSGKSLSFACFEGEEMIKPEANPEALSFACFEAGVLVGLFSHFFCLLVLLVLK